MAKAVIFTDQGMQERGIESSLFYEFSNLIDQVDAILGYSLKELCLDNAFNRLNQARFAQTATYVVNHLRYLKANSDGNLNPDYLAGHSLGECNALCAAGVFDFLTGLRIVQMRATLMERYSGGTMATVVGLTETELENLLKDCRSCGVEIAMYNAPHQFVIAGEKAEITRIASVFERFRGVEIAQAPNIHTLLHCSQMRTASREFHDFLSGFKFSDPEIPVLSNLTGRLHCTGSIGYFIAEQIANPVRWADGIVHLLNQGVVEFNEVGDAGLLASTVDEIKTHYRHIYRERKGSVHCVSASDSARGGNLCKNIIDSCTQNRDKLLVEYPYEGSAGKVTGGDLLAKTQQVGQSLADHTSPQDKIVVALAQDSRYLISLLGCWRANTVAVPIQVVDPAQLAAKRDEVKSIIASCNASCVLTSSEYLPFFDADVTGEDVQVIDYDALLAGRSSSGGLRDTTPNSLALILYTSGSTSQPKGVMIDHAALSASATSELWGVSPQSRIVSWLPQFHAFGLSLGLLVPLAQGAFSVVYSPDEFIRNPVSWFKLIHSYRATHSGAPNFAFEYCYNEINEESVRGISLTSLRSLACGGDIISMAAYDKLVRKFSSIGLSQEVLAPNYGLSEAGPISLKKLGDMACVSYLDTGELEEGRVTKVDSGHVNSRAVVSCGRIDENTTVIAVDPDTRAPLGHGLIGEIWIKAPCQALGYYNNSDATLQSFDAELSTTGERGFLRTGDLGFLEGNELYIVGRIKDLVIINGKNHHSVDIEHTVKMEAGLARCAAFSFRSSDLEKVVVVVETNEGTDCDFCSISDNIVRAVSEFHQIDLHEVVFVKPGTIPVTGSKKIKRAPCKKLYLSEALAILWRSGGNALKQRLHEPAYHSETEIVKRIKTHVLAPELGEMACEISPDKRFGEMGIDSIKQIRIAKRIEEEFGLPFKAGMLRTYNSCNSLSRFLLADENVSPAAVEKRNIEEYMDDNVIDILQSCVNKNIAVSSAIRAIKEKL